jgi:hypothetical protein
MYALHAKCRLRPLPMHNVMTAMLVLCNKRYCHEAESTPFHILAMDTLGPLLDIYSC